MKVPDKLMSKVIEQLISENNRLHCVVAARIKEVDELRDRIEQLEKEKDGRERNL